MTRRLQCKIRDIFCKILLSYIVNQTLSAGSKCPKSTEAIKEAQHIGSRDRLYYYFLLSSDQQHESSLPGNNEPPAKQPQHRNRRDGADSSAGGKQRRPPRSISLQELTHFHARREAPQYVRRVGLVSCT